jgi:hypothetical protein
LQNLKEIGLTNRIGISVYELADLEDVPKAVQIIQAPLNFFNTKFLTSVQVKKLKTEGVEFHARSIFHQGTLLNTSSVDSDFRADIVKFEIFCNTFNFSNMEAALSVYDSQDIFTKLLVGVVKAEQLLEIVNTKENIVDFDFVIFDFPDLASFTKKIADKTNSHFVELDEQNKIYRLINQYWQADFAAPRGSDINEDLKARDFTINSMALKLPLIDNFPKQNPGDYAINST